MTPRSLPDRHGARRTRPGRAARGRGGQPLRRGLTLLELMLALALSAVVLVAISTAVELHLRALQTRRDHLEHIQVARGVLALVAADLLATVQQPTTDFSALESLATGLASAGDVGGSRDTAGESGTGDESGAAGGGASGGAGTGDSPSGGGPGATGSLGDSADAPERDSAATAATTGIATATTVTAAPGLYGTQYELQVDVSRLPRVDQYERQLAPLPAEGLQDIPSDGKTVAYYRVDASSVSATGILNRQTGQPETGLVRRVLDRAVTLQAARSGNTQGLVQTARVLAPEVRQIEFQYFDGGQWLSAWDSCQQQRLPVAVKITVYVVSQTPLEADRARRDPPTPTTPLPSESVYSLVVPLPTAIPVESDSSSATRSTSGLDAVGP